MNKFIVILGFVPALLLAQVKPGNSTKPKAVPVKPISKAALNKLVDSAYFLFETEEDAKCEQLLNVIEKHDKNNSDVYYLRANLAVYKEDDNGVVNNLDKLYNKNKSARVYSDFAIRFLSNGSLSDSLKKVLSRKTIKIAPDSAEGYASLGLIYQENMAVADAMKYYQLSMSKKWHDTMERNAIYVP